MCITIESPLCEQNNPTIFNYGNSRPFPIDIIPHVCYYFFIPKDIRSFDHNKVFGVSPITQPLIIYTKVCRRFDQLGKGQNYINCKPTIHIGFLDFTPFPECPEFYATYKLLNIKNQHLYSDKFTLCVVDLTHIELATNEDIAYGIDLWAKLFKATTWEEIKMIAKNNPVIVDACESLYILNADEIARQRSRAREDAIARENALNQMITDQAAEIKRLETELAKYQPTKSAK